LFLRGLATYSSQKQKQKTQFLYVYAYDEIARAKGIHIFNFLGMEI
jgi:hypothetical protein